jgi:hypothetical protein
MKSGRFSPINSPARSKAKSRTYISDESDDDYDEMDSKFPESAPPSYHDDKSVQSTDTSQSSKAYSNLMQFLDTASGTNAAGGGTSNTHTHHTPPRNSGMGISSAGLRSPDLRNRNSHRDRDRHRDRDADADDVSSISNSISSPHKNGAIGRYVVLLFYVTPSLSPSLSISMSLSYHCYHCYHH